MKIPCILNNKNYKSERGQALILIAVGMVVMLGLTALAVDGGIALADRRAAQNAADNAALSAAYTIASGGTVAQARQSALNAAEINGYPANVQVHRPPLIGPYAGNNEYVQIEIDSSVNTAFASIVGVEQMNNTVQAVARARPKKQGSLFAGDGIVTLKPFDGNTLVMSGNPTIKTKNSGVFINSNGSCAFNASGNLKLHLDTGMRIGGGSACFPNNYKGPLPTITHVAQFPYPKPPYWNDVPDPDFGYKAPQITCPANNGTKSTSGNTTTLTPGKWKGSDLPQNGNVVFGPGVYCITGGVHFNAQVNLTMNNVTIFLQDGDFTFNGGASLSCNDMLFYAGPAAGEFRFNGNGTLDCVDVLFYIDKNNTSPNTGISFNGNATMRLKAKQSGPYKNLLVYIPYTSAPWPPGSQAQARFSGTSNGIFQGTILMPSRSLELSGNHDSAVYNSQLIVYTLVASGNVTANVSYDPEQNIGDPLPPIVELIE